MKWKTANWINGSSWGHWWIHINPTQCCVARNKRCIGWAYWYRICDNMIVFFWLSSIYDIKNQSVRRSMYVFFLGPRAPYTLYVRCDGDLFSRESTFTFLLKSWFVIKAKKILPCPRERFFFSFLFFNLSVTRERRFELIVIRTPFCFAWWIFETLKNVGLVLQR